MDRTINERPISPLGLFRLRVLMVCMALLAIGYRATTTVVQQGTSAIVIRLGDPVFAVKVP